MSSFSINRVLPYITTIVFSFVSVKALYTITHQREILIAIFLLFTILLFAIRKIITDYVFPEEEKIKIPDRDLDEDTILQFLDFMLSIVITIIMLILADIFITILNTISFQWFEYITLFSVPIFYIFIFMPKFE